MNDGVNVGAGIGAIAQLIENGSCGGCITFVFKILFYTFLFFLCSYLALQAYVWITYGEFLK
jgi:hypothetical protein